MAVWPREFKKWQQQTDTGRSSIVQEEDVIQAVMMSNVIQSDTPHHHYGD